VVHSDFEETLGLYDHQTCSSSTAAAKIRQIVQLLTTKPLSRYYVYEDDRYEAQIEPPVRERQERELKFLKKRYEGFAQAEEHIIECSSK
jgi:hypothetical protein